MSVRVLVASCPDLTDARIFALTHPRTGAAVQFVRTADALLEVHRFRDSAIPRSWLLGGQAQLAPPPSTAAQHHHLPAARHCRHNRPAAHH
eukprot:scaffold67253_cov63-Phaeocystis_antarctica.AAC.1